MFFRSAQFKVRMGSLDSQLQALVHTTAKRCAQEMLHDASIGAPRGGKGITSLEDLETPPRQGFLFRSSFL